MTTASEPVNDRRIGGEPARAIPTVKRDADLPDPLPVWYLKKRHEYEGRISQLERQVTELEMVIVKAANATRRQDDMNAITLYGRANSVEELMRAIAISPKFAGLNAAEHEFVARVGLATGLNPEFQLHAWKDHGKLVITPDYKGLMSLADRRFLMVKERRMNVDELRERGVTDALIAEGAIGYVVEGWELEKAKYCKSAGIDYEPLRGYGIWEAKKAEVTWKKNDQGKNERIVSDNRVDNDVPNGRDGAWVAWKRATRALFNQISDLSLKFGSPVPNARIEDEDTYVFEPASQQVIDGTFTVSPDPEPEDGEDFQIPAASWTNESFEVSKFEKWLSGHTITDDDFNDYLGHDWRTTPNDQEAMKDKCKWFLREREQNAPSESSAPEPDAGQKPDNTPAKCRICGERDADPSSLVDETLCEVCGSKEADRKASEFSQGPLFTPAHVSESDAGK